MDDREKVALVAQAIKSVFEANPLVRDDLEYDPGIWEEAARQAIAAYLNAWRTTIESEAEALESKGYRKSAKALRRVST